MRCPTCGADVDPQAYWCEACATRLQPVEQPRASEPEPVKAAAPRPPVASPWPDPAAEEPPTPSPRPHRPRVQPAAPPARPSRLRARRLLQSVTTSSAPSLSLAILVVAVIVVLWMIALIVGALDDNNDASSSTSPGNTRPGRQLTLQGSLTRNNSLVEVAPPDESFTVRLPPTELSRTSGVMRAMTDATVLDYTAYSTLDNGRTYELRWMAAPDADLAQTSAEWCTASDTAAYQLLASGPIVVGGAAWSCEFLVEGGYRLREVRLARADRLYIFRSQAFDDTDLGRFETVLASFQPTS